VTALFRLRRWFSKEKQHSGFLSPEGGKKWGKEGKSEEFFEN